MTPCPCGCQRSVKPGRQYAAYGCSSRAYWAKMNADERKQFIAKVRAKHGISRQQVSDWGREGGKTRGALWRQQAVEQFRHLPVEQAIVAAMKWALQVSRQRRWRAKQVGHDAR